MASTSETIVDVSPVVNETKKTTKSKVAKSKVDVPKSVPDVIEKSLSDEGTIEFLMTTVTHLQRRANEQDNEIEHLKARIAYLEEKVEDTPKTKKEVKEVKEKKPREPTAYNIFMKSKLVELKETHKELSNIERMKLAAEAWTESKK